MGPGVAFPSPDALSSGLMAYLLVSLRMAGLLLLAPPLSSMVVPAPVRLALVLALSAAVLPMAAPPVADVSLAALLQLSVLEFSSGALMALGVNVGFAAFGVGARLLDVQVGFGIGQVLDPSTRQRTPALSAAFMLVAPVVFLSTDGHHMMLRAFARGLERFPAGALWPMEHTARALFQQVQALFTLGLAMVAPVVFCLIMVELGLGVMARNLPQMNVFIMGAPIKVLSGLAALAAWMAATSAPMMRIFESIFRGWDALFR